MSDKGIRVNVNHKFAELLPQREALGNTRFRAEVIGYAMEEFGITLASAATHYNHAFKLVKANNPELVVGLGRPEDKKGGRKKKVVAEASTEVAAEQEFNAPEQTEFNVLRKSDGCVIAEKVSFEQAQALINKAKAAKKSTLYFV